METLTSPVMVGPLAEQRWITAGVDYYKPTMSQLQYEKHPDTKTTFTFHNRGEQRLAEYVSVDRLQARLDMLRQNGFHPEEIEYLRGLQTTAGERIFHDDFLDYLSTNPLPDVKVRLDEQTNDLAIETTGVWPLVTFWETVVMSEVNEAYFEGMVRSQGLDIYKIYEEGDRRLSEKLALLKERPDIKISDFGTRRHWSLRWQRHVNERMIQEIPGNLIGTSNVALAASLGIKPIGTFAHEMFMVYCALADKNGRDIRTAHNQVLEDWYDYYGKDLSTALTDTYGSDYFFADFTHSQAEKYRALRHDSGDPIEFGEKAIDFYKSNGIDPTSKTIVFSDGLDIDTIIALHDYFEGRINTVFGWGTTLTNDLGVKPLNIVMKATAVEGTPTVKLSDSVGKHTGPPDKVEEYKLIFNSGREKNHGRYFATV